MRNPSLIYEELQNHGWSITATELASNCWWAAEIWELQSEWTPRGATIYLTFLIDPMSKADNLGDAVWAIGLTHLPPSSRLTAEETMIVVKHRMTKAISEITSMAHEMRTAEIGWPLNQPKQE